MEERSVDERKDTEHSFLHFEHISLCWRLFYLLRLKEICVEDLGGIFRWEPVTGLGEGGCQSQLGRDRHLAALQ